MLFMMPKELLDRLQRHRGKEPIPIPEGVEDATKLMFCDELSESDLALLASWGLMLAKPTVEEYRQKMLNNLRNLWSQMVEHCREVGEPEPDPAQLAEWEAVLIKSGAAELMYENYCLNKAWAEAFQSHDPVALKYWAELQQSWAKPEPWGVREFRDMRIKWAKEKGLSELYRLAELPHTWHVEQVGDLCSITRDDRAIDLQEIPRSTLQRQMGFYGIVGDTFEDLCKQLDATGKATVVR